MTTTELPPDVWVPVSLRWRHVVAGDVFVAPDGRPWHVTEAQANNAGIRVEAQHGGGTYGDYRDPDDVVSVLVPTLERDAVELTREMLGARLVQRREATDAEQALPAPPDET